MKTFYEIKNVFAEDFGSKAMIEDVDMKSRTVTGYFSRFGNVDYSNEMVMPGAFTKSIKERGKSSKDILPHILDHDIHITLKQLSKPVLFEKKEGGFFESTISDTTNGIDTLKLYRDKVINQHSFGYKTLRSADKKDYKELQEVLLYEISTVTLADNDQTIFTGFKSLAKPKMISRYNHMVKYFRDGDYSDDVFEILREQIKQMEQDMVEIFISEQKEHNTETTAPIVQSVTQPGVELFNVIKQFRNTLNTTDNGHKTGMARRT